MITEKVSKEKRSHHSTAEENLQSSYSHHVDSKGWALLLLMLCVSKVFSHSDDAMYLRDATGR